MDGEAVTLISGGVAVVMGVLGYLGKELKTKHDERKRVPEEPGKNGKYVTKERLEEHCTGQLHVIATKFNAISEKQDSQREAVEKLTESIYQWKDEAVEKLADHGARLGAIERRPPHGR